jgi:hypothetical protein
MIESSDIKKRILSDYGEKADKVHKILDEAISKYDHLKEDRIIRCIIFLSDKNVNHLIEFITQAISDPRDVILWAEYENLQDNRVPIRIRDFNKPFENCEVALKK